MKRATFGGNAMAHEKRHTPPEEMKLASVAANETEKALSDSDSSKAGVRGRAANAKKDDAKPRRKNRAAKPEHKEPGSGGIAADALQMWMRNIQKSKLLTREEEAELAKRIEKGDQAAREEMAEANLRLVVSVAAKYQGHNVPLEDLIQEGNIGLMRAIDKFDYRRGYKFSTYAVWWIRQAVMRALDAYARSIRLPSYIIAKAAKCDEAAAVLRQKLEREPTPFEISLELKWPEEEVRSVMAIEADALPLDSPVGENADAVSMKDMIQDDRSGREETLENIALEQEIESLLGMLTKREQAVLQMRFGLSDGKNRSLREIGELQEVTRERIRQVETLALRKLSWFSSIRTSLHEIWMQLKKRSEHEIAEMLDKMPDCPERDALRKIYFEDGAAAFPSKNADAQELRREAQTLRRLNELLTRAAY